MNKTYSYTLRNPKTGEWIVINSTTYLILVAGPSCGGKTTFIKKVQEQLGESVSIIGTDQYYIPVASHENADTVNFDDPSRVRLDELYDDVVKILMGEIVYTPLYDYKLHARRKETNKIVPPQVLIVEGIFALMHVELCKIAEVKIFVEAAQVICFARRLKRDVEERGRTIDEVTMRFLRDVWPSTGKYVLPSKKEADIAIQNNEQDRFIGMKIVIDHIKTELQ